MVLCFILNFLYKKKRSISSHLVAPLFSLLCFPPTSNVNVFRHLRNNCSINCLSQQSSCFAQKSLKAAHFKQFDIPNNTSRGSSSPFSLNLISSPDQQSEPGQPGRESGIIHLTLLHCSPFFFTLIDSFLSPKFNIKHVVVNLLSKITFCNPVLPGEGRRSNQLNQWRRHVQPDQRGKTFKWGYWVWVILDYRKAQ